MDLPQHHRGDVRRRAAVAVALARRGPQRRRDAGHVQLLDVLEVPATLQPDRFRFRNSDAVFKRITAGVVCFANPSSASRGGWKVDMATGRSLTTSPPARTPGAAPSPWYPAVMQSSWPSEMSFFRWSSSGKAAAGRKAGVMTLAQDSVASSFQKQRHPNRH
jgi:hypothetical protein